MTTVSFAQIEHIYSTVVGEGNHSFGCFLVTATSYAESCPCTYVYKATLITHLFRYIRYMLIEFFSLFSIGKYNATHISTF